MEKKSQDKGVALYDWNHKWTIDKWQSSECYIEVEYNSHLWVEGMNAEISSFHLLCLKATNMR